MEKKTPLYEQHVTLGGRMVPFAGYLLPVQYPTGVIAEHMAVRQHAGLFDVSHMGEALLEGPDAERNLNEILSNSFTDMPLGSARYTLMLYENGGVVDDLIVYRIGQQKHVLVHKFVTKGTLEEKIELMLTQKQKLAGDIIAASSDNWIFELDNQQVLELFRLEA